jgi:PTS system cellobiose-specific IIB component
MKVLLVCSSGMSTSLLMNSMRKVAEPGDEVAAVAYSEMDDVADSYDVVLLGPQIRFRLREAEGKLAPKGKPVDVIDMRAYGTMDGAAVVGQARALLA